MEETYFFFFFAVFFLYYNFILIATVQQFFLSWIYIEYITSLFLIVLPQEIFSCVFIILCFYNIRRRDCLFFHFLSCKDTKRAFTEIFIYKINWKVTIVGFFQTEKKRFQANILCFAEIFEFWLIAFKILRTLYWFNNFFNFFLLTFSRLAGFLGLTAFWLLRFLHVVYPSKSLQNTYAYIKRTALITACW